MSKLKKQLSAVASVFGMIGKKKDGLYSGTGDNGNVEFLFDKKTHVLTITLGEDSIQVYYMINTNEAILFTSGHYASSFPYPIEWKDRKQVIVDGTLLKR